METNLVLEPTELAQWHRLFGEASMLCNFVLDEEVVSYLTFLVMRQTARLEVVTNAMALDFLDAQLASGELQEIKLRETADRCVIISGFFPGLAEKRLVRVGYFTKLAYSAYHQLSLGYPDKSKTHKMFRKVAHHVIRMVDLLSATRELAMPSEQAREPIQAWESFLLTNPSLQ